MRASRRRASTVALHKSALLGQASRAFLPNSAILAVVLSKRGSVASASFPPRDVPYIIHTYICAYIHTFNTVCM